MFSSTRSQVASLRGVSRPVAKLPPNNQPPAVMLSKELVSPADVRFVSLCTACARCLHIIIIFVGTFEHYLIGQLYHPPSPTFSCYARLRSLWLTLMFASTDFTLPPCIHSKNVSCLHTRHSKKSTTKNLPSPPSLLHLSPPGHRQV